MVSKCKRCNSIGQKHFKKGYCSKGCFDAAFEFDYLYVKGFGWENSIYLASDFETFNLIAENGDGIVYEGVFDTGKAVFLKK